MRPLRKIGLLLLALVLLPALGYVATRVHSLSENEALIEQIYDHQLETILFSVNQHAWDVTSSWAGDLERLLAQGLDEGTAVNAFLTKNPTVRAVFLADTALQRVQMITLSAPVQRIQADEVALTSTTVQKLAQRKQVGYRQLEPLILAKDSTGTTMALAFLADLTQPPYVVGMVLDANTFITDVLTPKLQDVARSRFTLGVLERSRATPVYATDTLRVEAIRQQRALWLFDDYTVGIHLRGTTIEEVMQARLVRDLSLIGLLALVLLIGAGIAYRNVRREVELARIKSTFVSNVSHELRTPLSLIRMYVETLELGRVTSETQRQHYYRVISQETLRLSRLINNILNFSRIEAGRKDFRMAPTDLNAVVRDVLDRYTLTLEQQGFETVSRLDEALPPVRGDAESITEALINLVDNATKYSTDRKKVALTTGGDGEAVFVEVADEGIGIAPEDQTRIFDAFYRASDSLVHDTKGTGLGLALVHKIMEAHGGRVTVDSRPGRGSRFRLYFHPVGVLHAVAES